MQKVQLYGSALNFHSSQFENGPLREWLVMRRCADFSPTKGRSYLAQLCVRVLTAKEPQTGPDSGSDRQVLASGQQQRSTALENYCFVKWLDHTFQVIATVNYPKL